MRFPTFHCFYSQFATRIPVETSCIPVAHCASDIGFLILSIKLPQYSQWNFFLILFWNALLPLTHSFFNGGKIQTKIAKHLKLMLQGGFMSVCVARVCYAASVYVYVVSSYARICVCVHANEILAAEMFSWRKEEMRNTASNTASVLMFSCWSEDCWSLSYQMVFYFCLLRTMQHIFFISAHLTVSRSRRCESY